MIILVILQFVSTCIVSLIQLSIFFKSNETIHYYYKRCFKELDFTTIESRNETITATTTTVVINSSDKQI